MSSTKQRQEAAKQARKAARKANTTVISYSINDDMKAEIVDIMLNKSSTKNKNIDNVLLVAKVAAKEMIANNVELHPVYSTIETTDAKYYEAAIRTLKKMNMSVLTIESAFVEHDAMILREYNIDMNKYAGPMFLLDPSAITNDLKKLPKQIAYESAMLNAIVSHMCVEAQFN